jgi:hypothetical protein
MYQPLKQHIKWLFASSGLAIFGLLDYDNKTGLERRYGGLC